MSGFYNSNGTIGFWRFKTNNKLQNVPRGTWQYQASVMFHVEHSQQPGRQESHE